MTEDVTASNNRFYFRVVAFTISVGLLVIILYEQLDDLKRHQHLIRDQFQLTVRMLTEQVALTSQQALLDRDNSALTHIVNNLASDPYILDVTIYDADGVPLARSEGALPYEQLGGFGAFRDQPTRPNLLVYVSEIEKAGRILGYMRLTIEQKILLSRTGELIEDEYHRSHIMLLLAILSGFLLATAFLPRRGGSSGKPY